MMLKLDRLSASKSYVVSVFSYFCKFVLYRFANDLDEELNILQMIGAYTFIVGASVILTLIGLWRNKVLPNLFIILFTDIWIFANILYYSANSIYLDWQIILCANNLLGFEDSIIAYLRWWMIIIPLLTIAIIYFLYFSKNVLLTSPLSKKYKLLILLSVILIYTAGLALVKRGNYISDKDHPAFSINHDKNLYAKTLSPLGYFCYVIWEGLQDSFFQVKSVIPYSAQEEKVLSVICTDTVIPATPQGHLVFILVESFESWALTAKDKYGNEVCENLNNFIRNNNVLLCTQVFTQQKHGRSGDGQLITQTGLLPISTGVTCMKYGGNTYPNLAHFYPNGVVLNPYPGVWNQKQTTYSYGYKRLREPPHIIKGTDSIIVKWAREELENVSVPTCVLAITINTHAPFTSVPASMQFSDQYSSLEADYLQSVHYMDRHVGNFLAWADTATTMQNATIVITADHNHFPRENGKGLCPLIIKSPIITQSINIYAAYQMDIFPTVLHTIGQSNYAWHGFGVDLLDTTAVRIISPEQAYALSDKMIRTDFFNKSIKK